jgi:hypothetical protein
MLPPSPPTYSNCWFGAARAYQVSSDDVAESGQSAPNLLKRRDSGRLGLVRISTPATTGLKPPLRGSPQPLAFARCG